MEDKNKDKQKRDMQLYLWLYVVPFSAVCWVGVLVVGLIALFIFACSAKYFFVNILVGIIGHALGGSNVFPAFVLTFIASCVVAVLVFSEVILIKKYIKFIKDFQKEKKEKLSSLNISQE